MKFLLWTDEQTAVLREMRERGCSFEEIGRAVGRTKSSTKERWRWINMPHESRTRRKDRINTSRVTPWTKAEMDHLLLLRDKYRKGWDEIAKVMGRPSGTVYSKYYYIKNLYTGPREAVGTKAIPQPIVDAWRQRMATAPRDITAALMGDPLPGHSALERR
jgi:hypothetical protein